MSIYCVYHLLRVRTFYQHIPKLVITDVPDGERPDEDLLERAGYLIPWANHVLTKVDVKESSADLVARIRQGEGEDIAWADLVARPEVPLQRELTLEEQFGGTE